MATTVLSLPHEVTIYTATEVAALCRAWLDEAPADAASLSVQADGVGEIDGAGLQVLVALAHSAALRNRAIEFAEPSAALRAACATLGASALLAPAGAVA
ncbi:hypothetical protein BH09PSE6_BH09PSE6_13670 [soil metagenome]